MYVSTHARHVVAIRKISIACELDSGAPYCYYADVLSDILMQGGGMLLIQSRAESECAKVMHKDVTNAQFL